MGDFTLELNEDQIQIQKWVHDFAENVIRPAAHEWDEREETPWPIIEEAARIGLYSFDFIAQAFFEQTGLLMPVANEEMAWGDAGIGLAIFGSSLADWRGSPATAPPSSSSSGGPSASAPRTKIQRPRSASPSPTPARTSPRCGPGPSTTRPRTSGSSTARRPGSPTAASPTSTWWWPRSIRSSDPRAGQLHRAPQHPGAFPGPEVPEDGHPGLPYRGGHPRRLPGAGALPARRQGQAGRTAGPGPRGKRSTSQAAMKTFEASRPTVGAQASGSPVPPTSIRSTMPRSARPSVGPSSKIRPSPSSWPT